MAGHAGKKCRPKTGSARVALVRIRVESIEGHILAR